MDLDKISLCIISLLGHAGRLPYEQLEFRTVDLLSRQRDLEISPTEAFRQTLEILCEQYIVVEDSPTRSPLYILSPWGLKVYCEEQRKIPPSASQSL